jgi:thiol-disulfide isomerase/thioredoxin
LGKVLAKEKNKLILADFWASWCSPCIAMDYQVWSDSTISALAQSFVCLRIDLSNGFNNEYPYSVDRIPTIMILDYQGKIIYNRTSFADRPEMQKILSSFPADVSLLYQALAECSHDMKNHTNLVFGAAAYQFYVKNTVSPAKDVFI